MSADKHKIKARAFKFLRRIRSGSVATDTAHYLLHGIRKRGVRRRKFSANDPVIAYCIKNGFAKIERVRKGPGVTNNRTQFVVLDAD